MAKRRTKKEQRARRRRRWLVATPFIVLVGIFWPLIYLVPMDSTAKSEPVKITNYTARYDVSAAGDLSAVETVTADFPNGRHGIFRFWDVVDPRDPTLRYVPTIESVTMDGHPEPTQVYSQNADRYTVAKIGNPDALLAAGTHVYQIAYSIPAVITPATAGPVPEFASSAGGGQAGTPPAQSVFWWDVVASGWRMPIAAANIVVNLPYSADRVQCSAKVAPTTEGPCVIGGVGTNTLVVSAKGIPAFGGMTLRASMAQPVPPPGPGAVKATWPWQLDPVLGRSPRVLGLSILLIAGAVVLGYGWTLATRERAPGLPVLYAPPDGLGPVQAVFVCDETPGDHDLAATLFHLAQGGLLSISAKSRTWTATATDALTPAAIATADPVSRALLSALELGAPGDEFRASASIGAGRRLLAARKAIDAAVKRWAADEHLVRLSIIGSVGRAVWVIAALAVLLGLTGRFGPTIWALIPLGFLVAGFRLVKRGAIRRRSAAGRAMWSCAGGFRRMLATPSSELRFDFAARRDFFLPCLPYAVAFGVAKQWSDKYADEMDEPPPTPDWINMASNRLTTTALISTVNSFQSTVNSTISAYQSQSSSSSSSGGGSSVGSGGGGGGGGSW